MRYTSKLHIPTFRMPKVPIKLKFPTVSHRYTKKSPMPNFHRNLKAAEKASIEKFTLQYGRKPTEAEKRALNGVLEGGTKRRQRRQRGTRRR